MAEGTFVPNYKIDQGMLNRMRSAGRPIERFGTAFDEMGEMGGTLMDWAVEKGGGVDALKARVAENKAKRERTAAVRRQRAKDSAVLAGHGSKPDGVDSGDDAEVHDDSVDNFDQSMERFESEVFGGSESSDSAFPQRKVQPNNFTSTETNKTSTNDLINNNFGWGIEAAKERGMTMNTSTYDEFTNILKQKKLEFLEVQKNGGNTLNEIGKLSELSNGLQGFKESLESIADIHNSVGWSKSLKPQDKWMMDVLSDQTTTYPVLNKDNKLAFVITDPNTGEERLAAQKDLDDVLTKKIKPAARELEYKKYSASLYELGFNGGNFDVVSQFKANENAITRDNIESYMLDPWTGIDSFVEEAEHDKTYNEFDVSAKNLYSEALKDPTLFNETRAAVARWLTAKQMQVFKNGESKKKENEEEALEKINTKPTPTASTVQPGLGERIATGIASAVKRVAGNAWGDAQKVLYPTKKI